MTQHNPFKKAVASRSYSSSSSEDETSAKQDKPTSAVQEKGPSSPTGPATTATSKLDSGGHQQHQRHQKQQKQQQQQAATAVATAIATPLHQDGRVSKTGTKTLVCVNCGEEYDPDTVEFGSCRKHRGLYLKVHRSKASLDRWYNSPGNAAEEVKWMWLCCGKSDREHPGCQLWAHCQE